MPVPTGLLRRGSLLGIKLLAQGVEGILQLIVLALDSRGVIRLGSIA